MALKKHNLHPRFHDAVRLLHPGADSMTDYRIRDDLDGRGAFIDHWGLPGQPPTRAEIDALIPTLEAANAPQTKAQALDAMLGKHGLSRDDLKALLKSRSVKPRSKTSRIPKSS